MDFETLLCGIVLDVMHGLRHDNDRPCFVPAFASPPALAALVDRGAARDGGGRAPPSAVARQRDARLVRRGRQGRGGTAAHPQPAGQLARGARARALFQRQAGRDQPANIKSASKSVISALVGIAIDRGHIKSVKQPVADFFPDLFAGTDDPKREITIEDLLTMRSGLESTSNRNYGAWVQSRNWVRYALARPLLAEPGTRMQYSTGNSHVLSAILTKATGKSTWQFAQEALAKPLGFSLAQWPRDPQGIYFGGNDMLMTPRQMVAFGELYLNRGRVKERPARSGQLDRHAPSFRAVDRIQRAAVRLRLVDPRDRRPAGVLRLGLRRSVHLPRAGLDLVVVSTSSAAVSDERRSHRRTVDDIIEYFIVEPISDHALSRLRSDSDFRCEDVLASAIVFTKYASRRDTG